MPNQDCVALREQLSKFPGEKLGFAIYRLTYEDDGQWSRVIEHIKKRTRENLEASGDGDLVEHIDWTVQEDPELDGAHSGQVRKHFLRWVDSEGVDRHTGNPRYMACVAIEQFLVERCLKDADAEEDPDDDLFQEKGFVMLVSADKKEDVVHVAVSSIFPRVYSLLESSLWDVIKHGAREQGVYNS